MDTNCVPVITWVCLYLNTTGSLCACCVRGYFFTDSFSHAWHMSLVYIQMWHKLPGNRQRQCKSLHVLEKKKKNKEFGESTKTAKFCWGTVVKEKSEQDENERWLNESRSDHLQYGRMAFVFVSCIIWSRLVSSWLGTDLMFLLLIFFISLLQQKLQWKYKSHDSCIS